MASLLYILSVLNRTVAPIVMAIATLAALGVIMGLIARFTLPRRSAPMHWLVALFGLSIGMAFLGWLSRGSLGMNLIGRTPPDPDWFGLIRYVCSAAVAWVAVRAWTEQPAGAPSIPAPRRKRTSLRGTSLKEAKPGRIGRRKRAKIHLATAVEHRCPFCLEIVEDKDPRGIKECSTCHARHHADCWAVTGTCQVPHHNS